MFWESAFSMTGVKSQSSAAKPVDLHRDRRYLIGSSAGMSVIRELIAKVSPSDSTVLLLGESGTGKEVVARAVHAASSRSRGPFIPVNCGAIPGELLESELFGHEKGAFTGAINMRHGRFEMAQGGTLFLDEIGDMPLEMQVKLLRVLQEHTFERVGGTKSLQSDVRIVAATHQHLEQKVDAGSFRMDLFYRLNVFPIDLQPLRERVDDLLALADHFLKQFESRRGVTVRLMPDTLRHLEDYSWPGNVRELRNLLERLIILYPNADVYAADLPQKYQSSVLDVLARPNAPLPKGDSRDRVNGDAMAEKPTKSSGEARAPATAPPSEDLSELYAAPQCSLDVTVADPASDHASANNKDPFSVYAATFFMDEPIDLKAHLVAIERELILTALHKTDWINAQAAKLLGLQRTTLVEKMRKYGLQRSNN